MSGLTTAAGVWVVAAIGLACGGGMYKVAIVSTLLVLAGLEAFNYFLHKFDKHRKQQSKGGEVEIHHFYGSSAAPMAVQNSAYLGIWKCTP